MAKLYLIAGHGAGDSGAVGNGYTEAERVRTLCAKMKELGGNDVEYLDSNRNWYADKGITTLNIPSGSCLLECHMDSGGSSARGGHVIICEGLNPDSYDKALESMIKIILPGRAQTIVKRGNLANPNRAKARGINYRLVEFGFISNKNDLDVFNTKLTEIATKTLACFGINVKEVDNMANVFQDTLTGSDKQKWRPELLDGKWMLRNKYNGEYLDVAGASPKNGTDVQTYKKNNSDAQKWIIKQIDKGYNPKAVAPFNVISALDSKACLDVEAGSKKAGANVDIYAPNETNAQKFAIIDTGDGYWIVVCINSLMALSV